MKLNVKALTDVEIGFPVIAEGVYHARIVKEKTLVKPNKKGDGNNLVVAYKILDNPLFLHKDGKEIDNKGQIVLTRYYSLVPTADYDPDKNLKELAVAIGHAPDKDLELEDLADKLVMVKVAHKEAEGQYPAGNDVQRATPVPADDAFTIPPFG